ncbi:hypothetical protein [Streptomyces sporangiiformans]|uniref:Uncharacterized protein n=1 Tax=Streptomyces sporangiiformans TaxID=2315329 RepID=A0A505DBY7_9ACTN|nr:hypothetical protein [Streptomyces sporangiiformans]TPQ22043.1 hypothetical protein FGD71_011650 [Streptomyces sporangiiformans]
MSRETRSWVWHKGYFRTVTHEEPSAAHLLDRHCFYDPSSEWYVDENDLLIPERPAQPSERALRRMAKERAAEERLAGG